MSIIETIQKRYSVRTYTKEKLSKEHTELIKQYINQLKTPFGEKARIELINGNCNAKPAKLGTYGIVKNATDYLVLICEKKPFTETAAAYMFEQVILFCTSLSIGTCWIGGTFNRSDFIKQINLGKNEQIRVISPVGYESKKKRFVEKYILQTQKKHISRKYFEELFFYENFNKPLTEDNAGQFFIPLKMVRLAPSANNKQEWRVLLKNNSLHFFKKPNPVFDNIDMGIALCHFELTCKEMEINGHFKILKNYPTNNELKYVISWLNN